MANVWITYAWADNSDGDVNYIANELIQVGLQVRLDRWTIRAGERLWKQIEAYIQNPALCDAWVLYATQASLTSEACQEEYAYALDRALKSRGSTFPIIGLFSGAVSTDLIPAGIRTRLYVSTVDPDWRERIQAAAEGRAPRIATASLDPFSAKVHHVNGGHLIEVRPRAGVWYPFRAAVPLDEKEQTVGKRTLFLFDAPGRTPELPQGFILHFDGEGVGSDQDGSEWWHIDPAGDVTPYKSFFLFVGVLPSVVAFGPRKGPLHLWRSLKE